MSRRGYLGAVGATGAALAVGVPGAAAQESTDLDWGSDYTQNPRFTVDAVTKAKHDLAAWGADDAALKKYENDAGEVALLPGEVNRDDTENAITLRADRVQSTDMVAFPRSTTYDDDNDTDTDEEEVRALDATHWATDTSGSSAGSLTVDDGGLDVEHSLAVASSGVASGETAVASFDLAGFDAAIDDDEAKRFLQVVANVASLDSGATVEVAVVDADGDEKVASIGDGLDADATGTIATATGSGIVYQERLGDLATAANGDGTFSTIERVEVRFVDGDADLTFSGLNVEKMSRWVFGSYIRDEGTDDAERVDRNAPSGAYTVTDLGTIDVGGDAMLYDVEFPIRFDLATSDLAYEYEFVETDAHPGYDYVFRQVGKVEVPTGYDLSYSGITFDDEVTVPASRYLLARVREGVGDTSFDDLTDDDEADQWSDVTGSYSSQGDTVTFSSTVEPGVAWATEYKVLVTSDERDAIESGASSGGGGAMFASTGGSGGIMGWVMAIVAGVVGYVALMRRRLGA